MFPYRLMIAASLGGAYLLSSGRIPQWPAPGFLAAFSGLLGIQLLAWVAWAVMLYPKLFSPLRGLPEPDGNALFMGQWKAITSLPTGNPMMEWYVFLSPPSQVRSHPGLFC
jgi:hypothetical protein